MKSSKSIEENSDLLLTNTLEGNMLGKTSTLAVDKSIYMNPTMTINQRVKNLLSQMTLEEKIGQMTQVDRQFLKSESNISKYYLGSLLSGGGSTPKQNTPSAWANMVDSYQKIALSTKLGIPIIYGIDAVHGHNNVYGATIFPHNIGLGCTRNPDLIKAVNHATALEIAATGIDWTFAPCLAVIRDERWGRTYEGFGETATLVEEFADAAITGFQSENLTNPKNVLACAKHFIGDGGTQWGSGKNKMLDRGDTKVTEKELREIHLPGYLAAIDAGVGSIMASFNQWNGEYCHGSKYLLTNLLKEELGFEGFVVSDWEGIDQIPGDYKSDIITSINAGIDMVMVPGAAVWGGQKYQDFIKLCIEAVNEELIPESRINDAVSRILRIKFKLGLFEHPYSDSSLLAHIGSDKHRKLARKAVRQSMVLLKNDGILPLSKNIGHIHVSGKNADNLGNQCGGWTISWQGKGGPITIGTTIFEAIEKTVSSNTIVTYSEDGTGADGANVGIVVIGEKPYAEWEGDTHSLELDEEDLITINRFREKGIKVVVILVSGRPMILEGELENWNGLIAAWLPGSEGEGVADVIFGNYNPTGKLSVSWLRNMEQIPINFGDENYDPLFEFGFGLNY
ncbi:MAG: glycoside hydrolase family 3 protein [Candidatus Marinimicrobia bacterium]|nr:glycoside hydrolase family 3 protein [Candidatus Neomarinimicrobiota bacterium]